MCTLDSYFFCTCNYFTIQEWTWRNYWHFHFISIYHIIAKCTIKLQKTRVCYNATELNILTNFVTITSMIDWCLLNECHEHSEQNVSTQAMARIYNRIQSDMQTELKVTLNFKKSKFQLAGLTVLVALLWFW